MPRKPGEAGGSFLLAWPWLSCFHPAARPARECTCVEMRPQMRMRTRALRLIPGEKLDYKTARPWKRSSRAAVQGRDLEQTQTWTKM